MTTYEAWLSTEEDVCPGGYMDVIVVAKGDQPSGEENWGRGPLPPGWTYAEPVLVWENPGIERLEALRTLTDIPTHDREYLEYIGVRP